MPAAAPVTNRSAAAVRSNTSAPSTVSVSRRRSSACRGTCGSVIRAIRNETAGISGVSASVGTATTAAAPSKPMPKAYPTQAAITPSSAATASPKNSGTSAGRRGRHHRGQRGRGEGRQQRAWRPGASSPVDLAGTSSPARNA